MSEMNRVRKLKFGMLVQAFTGTTATCKNLSARGRLERSAALTFYFWDSLHISVTNGARKLKFCIPVSIYDH